MNTRFFYKSFLCISLYYRSLFIFVHINTNLEKKKSLSDCRSVVKNGLPNNRFEENVGIRRVSLRTGRLDEDVIEKCLFEVRIAASRKIRTIGAAASRG